ncbi:tail fiber protein [Pseudomonas putida]|nr:tail fiber protein [Pseudomonas putida]
MRAAALAQRDGLMAVATARMAPLQDAVDLGEATASEEAVMLSWKRYRVALNRIELQPEFPIVDWPASPETTA